MREMWQSEVLKEIKTTLTEKGKKNAQTLLKFFKEVEKK